MTEETPTTAGRRHPWRVVLHAKDATWAEAVMAVTAEAVAGPQRGEARRNARR